MDVVSLAKATQILRRASEQRDAEKNIDTSDSQQSGSAGGQEPIGVIEPTLFKLSVTTEMQASKKN